MDKKRKSRTTNKSKTDKFLQWNPRKITDPEEIAMIENLMKSKGARLSGLSF